MLKKYTSDYRSYMNRNWKEDNQQSCTPSVTDGYTSDTRLKPIISLDIWDKQFRVNSASSYRNILAQPREYIQQSLLEFAAELKLPVQLLIEEFESAGIPHLTPEVIISEHHKSALLDYLRKEHGTLNPKTRPSRTEVRKKRILLAENSLIAPIVANPLYQNECPSPKVIVSLEDINDELLFYLGMKPEIIHKLGSRKFEELIAKLFADKGYEVSLTKSTRDGGYDIFAKVKNDFSDFIILAECKKYSPVNKVGVEIVRGLYGVVEEHKANQGIIITSSFFTKEAQQTQLRIGNRMALKDYNDLVEWIKPYSRNV